MTHADEVEQVEPGGGARPRRLSLRTVVALVAVMGLAGVAIGAWVVPDEEAAHAAPAPVGQASAQVRQALTGDQADAVRPARYEWTSPTFKVVGERRWIELSNSYHAVVVDAINTTSSTLALRHRGPVVLAAYANAPGIFEATCQAVKGLGEQVTSRELLETPYGTQETIPPGGRATFRCVQVMGSLPEADTMPAGELRIDRRRVFFVS
jgi:hypothetical protein